jgi:hypothetical protein
MAGAGLCERRRRRGQSLGDERAPVTRTVTLVLPSSPASGSGLHNDYLASFHHLLRFVLPSARIVRSSRTRIPAQRRTMLHSMRLKTHFDGEPSLPLANLLPYVTSSLLLHTVVEQCEHCSSSSRRATSTPCDVHCTGASGPRLTPSPALLALLLASFSLSAMRSPSAGCGVVLSLRPQPDLA